MLEDAGLVTTRREGRCQFHDVDTSPLKVIVERWPIEDRRVQRNERQAMIRIDLASVLVDDQAKALTFSTEVLGFQKKHDVPLGGARWLTVVSPADPDGPELVLEPDSHPAVKPFKTALYGAVAGWMARRTPAGRSDVVEGPEAMVVGLVILKQ